MASNSGTQEPSAADGRVFAERLEHLERFAAEGKEMLITLHDSVQSILQQQKRVLHAVAPQLTPWNSSSSLLSPTRESGRAGTGIRATPTKSAAAVARASSMASMRRAAAAAAATTTPPQGNRLPSCDTQQRASEPTADPVAQPPAAAHEAAAAAVPVRQRRSILRTDDQQPVRVASADTLSAPADESSIAAPAVECDAAPAAAPAAVAFTVGVFPSLQATPRGEAGAASLQAPPRRDPDSRPTVRRAELRTRRPGVGDLPTPAPLPPPSTNPPWAPRESCATPRGLAASDDVVRSCASMPASSARTSSRPCQPRARVIARDRVVEPDTPSWASTPRGIPSAEARDHARRATDHDIAATLVRQHRVYYGADA